MKKVATDFYLELQNHLVLHPKLRSITHVATKRMCYYKVM